MMGGNIPPSGLSQVRGSNVPLNPPPPRGIDAPPNIPPQGGRNPPIGFLFLGGNHPQSGQYTPPNIPRNVLVPGGFNPPQQGTPVLSMGNPYKMGGYAPM